MLSLQIILTYKSRLKYGNQKNSWKVSIHCKTPMVGCVEPTSESRPCEEIKMGILVTVGQLLLSVRLAEESGWLRIPAQRSTSSRELLGIWWVPLISRDGDGHQCKACHPSIWSPLQTSSVCWSEEDFGELGFHYQEFVCDLNEPLNL